MHATLRLTIGLVLLGALSLTACHDSSSTVAPDEPGVAGPMNDKDRMEAERWARATRGLDFEAAGGRVAVEPIFPRDEAAAERHLASADQLFAANRTMDAMEQYGLAARQDPDLADAYVGLGATLRVKGKLDRARAAFRTALDHDDRNLEARYQLAMALWEPATQQEAITEMNAVLAIDDGFAKAHERLAMWNYYVGDYETAWRQVHRVEELGQQMPPQFMALLKGQMTDPEAEP
jgi:tetratricopeptide (TPR) repeat protein